MSEAAPTRRKKPQVRQKMRHAYVIDPSLPSRGLKRVSARDIPGIRRRRGVKVVTSKTKLGGLAKPHRALDMPGVDLSSLEAAQRQVDDVQPTKMATLPAVSAFCLLCSSTLPCGRSLDLTRNSRRRGYGTATIAQLWDSNMRWCMSTQNRCNTMHAS
jgi:hypothetical protein